MLLPLRHWSALACLALLPLAGCESDEPVQERAAEEPSSEDASAILLAVRVRNPEGRNIYVGAVPELPEGQLDYSEFIEFDSVDVYAANGFVYVWEREPATVVRFSVGEDLQLERGPSLDLSSYGLSGGGLPVFVSEQLAYVMSAHMDVIVKLDPSQMEITGTIEVPSLDRPMLDNYPYGVYKLGDKTAWLLNSQSADLLRIHHSVSLLLLDHKSGELQLVTDDRCAGGEGAFLDERGDLYVRANANWGMYAAYGDDHESVHTCMLRIRKGETQFDDSFMLDNKELTGTYVNGPWYHIEGSRYLAHVWSNDVPIPESLNDFWLGEGYEQYLVDIDARTLEPYAGLEDSIIVNALELELDGRTYYQSSSTGSKVNAETAVVELRPEGIEKVFELPELWALDRIR